MDEIDAALDEREFDLAFVDLKMSPIDGMQVHLRDEGWKEMKLGAVFELALRQACDERSGERGAAAHAVNVSYAAHLGGPDVFGGLVFAEARSNNQSKTALLEAFPGLELEVQEITFLPQATKTLSGEDLASFEKFLGMLNDCDDVQEIYHNISLP